MTKTLFRLYNEYQDAVAKWIEVNRLRTDWVKEDPVYDEVFRDYEKKMNAYYRQLRKEDGASFEAAEEKTA